jgi:hypothetical protein
VTCSAIEHGQIPAGLRGIYQALAAVERPGTVASWLDSSTGPAVLRDFKAGRRSLSHQALDELPPGKTLEHLRSVLVATGTLPPRDEQLIRLERWIAQAITGRPDPGQQQLVHRYAIWHVVRRLRSRLGGAHATYSQAVAARRNIKAATVLLNWLTARGLTLATARQADLDAWLSSEHGTYRANAGDFIRWARKHKLTRLDSAAARWSGPSGVIDTESRWEQARWLLHDSTLKPEDRVAGLLVLLYAQWPTAISRLTLGHVDTSDDQVRIRLGREPVILPEPLDALVLQLTATRHGHAAIGDPGTSPWLFPGGQPGQPISAYQLAERLRHLGVRSGNSRFRRAIPARHRPARRHPRPDARNPHHRRGHLAARRRRRLGRLRRRHQPPPGTLTRCQACPNSTSPASAAGASNASPCTPKTKSASNATSDPDS